MSSHKSLDFTYPHHPSVHSVAQLRIAHSRDPQDHATEVFGFNTYCRCATMIFVGVLNHNGIKVKNTPVFVKLSCIILRLSFSFGEEPDEVRELFAEFECRDNRGIHVNEPLQT